MLIWSPKGVVPCEKVSLLQVRNSMTQAFSILWFHSLQQTLTMAHAKEKVEEWRKKCGKFVWARHKNEAYYFYSHSTGENSVLTIHFPFLRQNGLNGILSPGRIPNKLCQSLNFLICKIGKKIYFIALLSKLRKCMNKLGNVSAF